MSTKAIFLDRDGVINEERKDYVKNLSEFKILEGVSDAIKLLKKKNYLIIIITNQSAINRGFLSIKELMRIHQYFQDYLRKNNTSVDAIYYCPHKPEENCSCRKPKPGLILKARNDFNINLEKSLIIGDSIKDIEAANAAGCNGILLEKDQSLFQVVKKIVDFPDIS